eukprot:m.10996 g.10996  ORF g.10996 m.10996 type:complete len:73 (+) comp22866_c0_seq2:101-319(+)
MKALPRLVPKGEDETILLFLGNSTLNARNWSSLRETYPERFTSTFFEINGFILDSHFLTLSAFIRPAVKVLL